MAKVFLTIDVPDEAVMKEFDIPEKKVAQAIEQFVHDGFVLNGRLNGIVTRLGIHPDFKCPHCGKENPEINLEEDILETDRWTFNGHLNEDFSSIQAYADCCQCGRRMSLSYTLNSVEEGE